MATLTTRAKRRSKYEQGETSPHSIRIPDAMWKEFERRRDEERFGPVNQQIVTALVTALEEAEVRRTTAPYLGSVPCGPLEEALKSAKMIDLGDTAQHLNLRPGDFFLSAKGDSMLSHDERRHIPNGALIQFRRGLDPHNQIALCAAVRATGEYEYTVKRYTRDEQDRVVLKDGEGNPFPLPEDMIELRVEAVRRGIITEHLDDSDSQLREQIKELSETVEDLDQELAALNAKTSAEFKKVASSLGFPDAGKFAKQYLKLAEERGPARVREWFFGDAAVQTSPKQLKEEKAA